MSRQPNTYGGNGEPGYPPFGATRPMYNDGDDDNDGGDDDALDSDDDSEPNGNGGKQRGGRGAPDIKHRRKATQRPVVRIYPVQGCLIGTRPTVLFLGNLLTP